MNRTTNYKLCQWEETDRVQRTDFNEDNVKIDAAIKAEADARAAGIAAVNAVLAQRGNCQIVTGQYIGDGQCGQSRPNSLTFSHPPVLVLVSEYNTLVMAGGGSHGYVLQNGTSEMIDVSWNGNSLSWYSTRGVSYQMNIAGTVYHYVALLAL